jgi:hypothetical protein
MNFGKTQRDIDMNAKGDYLDRAYLDQMALRIVRWGGWTAWAVAKGYLRGSIRLKSTQIRWFS